MLIGCGDDAPVSGGTDTDGSSSSSGDPTTGVGPTTGSSTTDAETTAAETTGPDTETTDTDGTDTDGTDTDGDTDTDTGGPVCGDGVVEGDESCDDRGESETCNVDCTAAACGDGVLNESAGEACDDAGDSETCDADCTVAECGDMTVNDAAGEACDDGAETETCNANCTTSACGDGELNETAGETCDDAGESAMCDTDCSAAECGDGLLNPTASEECEGGPGCSDACVITCAAFGADTFDANTMFAGAVLTGTPVALAWNGTELYSGTAGGTSGDRLAQHAEDGVVNAVYAPGIDLRSVFTLGDGTATVYARAFSDSTLRVMGDPGVFADDVTLATAEPNLDNQSAVVWNDDADEFVALTLGAVLRWSADGSFVGITTLQGLGDTPAESEYPSSRSLAWAQGCYLTYADGELSSWDITGQRVDTTTLSGQADTFAAESSLSYANGEVFIGDGTDWFGFAVW